MPGGSSSTSPRPDYETRVAILRRKAEERRATFAEGVLEAVAGLDIDNVRELLGALNRLIAFQAVSETPLTPEQARLLVGGEAGDGAGAPAAEAPPKGDRDTPAMPRPAAALAAATSGAGASAGATAAATAAAPAAASEFDDFLSEIAATVAQQVDAWRTRVSAAMLRWQGEGFRTAQLEALLEQEMVNDPERALREFEEDIQRLQTLQAEAAALAPELAGSAAFRDPANLAAAEEALRQAREEGPPPPAPSPLWRLDGFVETPANRVVLEAARAVAASPGDKYNPLVLVGAAAVGKTHLLHAIGNALGGRADARRLPERARVHRRADPGHRPRCGGRVAGPLSPGDRLPAG